MSNETTDRVPKSALGATGQWAKQHVVQPVVDHTAVLVSLVESNDRKDQMTIRMLISLAGAFMLLFAVFVTLLLGGSFQASTTGVSVNATPHHIVTPEGVP